MNWIFYVLIALVAGLAGTGLFQPARLTVEQKRTERGGEPSEKTERRLTACRIGLWVSVLFLTGFLALYYRTDLMLICRTMLLCAILWVCAWSDLAEHLIPNKVLLLGLLGLAAVLSLDMLLHMELALYILLSTVLAALFMGVAGVLCRLVTPGAMGWGDVKLIILMGAYLGQESIWSAIFCSLLCCFAVSVFLLVTRRADRKTEIPFAPFLLAGTMLAAFLTGI